ncbi:hypothetical protein [uncultured Vibrio sp.]|uniref:hypothetical protein n=1 Tax=uncultured Vibrio sp. TaxID=114054 RepID=UPI00260B9105|nr:hypothetical protein [uncultured Vibrio sp.]
MKVLTLDVWDTLIRRRCHPDTVKMESYDYLITRLGVEKVDIKFHDTAIGLKVRQNVEYELAVESKSIGYDDEYSIFDVIVGVIKKITSISENETNKVAFEVIEFEKKIEYSITYPDPGIIDKVKEISPDECYFISDFYMDKDFLLGLLRFHGFDFILDGVSSCDSKLNKKSGRLFDYFVDNLAPKREFKHYHIGDNYHADVESPLKKGISATHYLPNEEHSLRGLREETFNKRLPLIDSEYDVDIDAFELGAKTSMLYYGFVRFIASRTSALGLKKVAFFTREGEFFKQVYDQVNENLPKQFRGPESVLIEVSRMATFFPSMGSFSIEEMMRVWNLYSTQSMGAMFKTLNVDRHLVEEFVIEQGIDWDEDIQHPWQDERVIAMFESDSLKNLMNKELIERRLLLKSYFTQHGIDGVNDFAIVDIGWRGTIQDNIARIFTDTQIHGFYLGLANYLNPQPKNSFKYSLSVNLNLQNFNHWLLNAVSPLEMISNSENGSTIGYLFDHDAQVYMAVRKIDDLENKTFNNFTKAYQNGVLSSTEQIEIKNFNDFRPLVHIISEATRAWVNIVRKPTVLLSNEFFSLHHNEEFGIGGHVSMSNTISFKLILKSLFSKQDRLELYRKIVSVQWPEGYLLRTNSKKLDKIIYKIVISSALLYKKLRVKI